MLVVGALTTKDSTKAASCGFIPALYTLNVIPSDTGNCC